MVTEVCTSGAAKHSPFDLDLKSNVPDCASRGFIGAGASSAATEIAARANAANTSRWVMAALERGDMARAGAQSVRPPAKSGKRMTLMLLQRSLSMLQPRCL